MAVYTKEYESQPEAILTNVIICPAVDLSANVAVPVHCQVENVLWDTGATDRESEAWAEKHTPFAGRLPVIARDAWGIVRGVLVYVLVGIGVGAAMHGFVPEGFFEQYMSKENWFAVPLAVVCAVPMYANAAGIVPVIQVFVAKGIPLGTAIAFMMGVVGLSLPEATMLKKVMTWRLIGIFFGVVTLFIILSGYVFNLIL